MQIPELLNRRQNQPFQHSMLDSEDDMDDAVDELEEDEDDAMSTPRSKRTRIGA